mmetsp:Transcript_132511/g.283206  ORF Transcript_132511/g.283206 Transcript_132511/m.283206 type:complete len:153 (+) Transcript_132511:39-497(+)
MITDLWPFMSPATCAEKAIKLEQDSGGESPDNREVKSSLGFLRSSTARRQVSFGDVDVLKFLVASDDSDSDSPDTDERVVLFFEKGDASAEEESMQCHRKMFDKEQSRRDMRSITPRIGRELCTSVPQLKCSNLWQRRTKEFQAGLATPALS